MDLWGSGDGGGWQSGRRQNEWKSWRSHWEDSKAKRRKRKEIARIKPRKSTREKGDSTLIKQPNYPMFHESKIAKWNKRTRLERVIELVRQKAQKRWWFNISTWLHTKQKI